MPWEKCQESIYSEIKNLNIKMDDLAEQITLLRIDMAENKIKINDARKFNSVLWGLLGGLVSAAGMAAVDLVIRGK